MNFPMQSNGAEMMRISAIAGTEAGIQVAAPIHDAFFVMAPIDQLDADVTTMREIMRKASLAITGDVEIRTDVAVVVPAGQAKEFGHWGEKLQVERYVDERGTTMWQLILRLLTEIERDAHRTRR